MQERKRGGQPGNGNAMRHGKYSRRLRAERRAALAPKLAEQAIRHAEWMKTIPPTDYAAICAAIAATKSTKH